MGLRLETTWKLYIYSKLGIVPPTSQRLTFIVFVHILIHFIHMLTIFLIISVEFTHRNDIVPLKC